MADPIRVLVVDDHPVVRHGLVAILRYETGIDVVGEAADGAAALAQILASAPDVVLLDLRLPTLSGVDVMLQARASGSVSRFLVLTTYDTDAYIAPALAAGARGYLLKDAMPDELARAIRSLLRSGAALTPAVAARLLDRSDDGLSERELDVLTLLVSGATNKSIAAELGISENTIKTHLSHIFDKLAVQSRAEAVAAALQRGLVSPSERR